MSVTNGYGVHSNEDGEFTGLYAGHGPRRPCRAPSPHPSLRPRPSRGVAPPASRGSVCVRTARAVSRSRTMSLLPASVECRGVPSLCVLLLEVNLRFMAAPPPPRPFRTARLAAHNAMRPKTCRSFSSNLFPFRCASIRTPRTLVGRNAHAFLKLDRLHACRVRSAFSFRLVVLVALAGGNPARCGGYESAGRPPSSPAEHRALVTADSLVHGVPPSSVLVPWRSSTVWPGSNTLQAAVDHASDGDELVLANGTYTGPGNQVVSIGKDVVIRALHPGQVVLDGEKTRSVVYIYNGTVVLWGLQITRVRCCLT